MVLWFMFVVGMVPFSKAAEEVLFSGCDVTDYYANLTLLDLSAWSREALVLLLFTTHRRVLPYTGRNGDSDDDVWQALIDLDQSDSSDATLVQLLYSNGTPVPAFPHGTPATWNREHIWPKSRGVGYDGADFTDVHNLRPADWNVNAVRSNLYFGNCMDSECQAPADDEAANDTAKNSDLFTPPARDRGNVARALLYMDIRYSAANNDNMDLSLTDCPEAATATRSGQDDDEVTTTEMAYLSALLQWHWDDPVDAREVERNSRSCSRWQGNRNPFVDFPELATHLFGDLAPSENCTSTTPATAPTSLDDAASPVTAPVVPPTLANASVEFLLQPGDIMIVGVQSDNPDWVALLTLRNVPVSTMLLLTDNVWIKAHSSYEAAFRSNEGSLVLTIPADLPAGTVFGYGPSLLHGELWNASDKGFALSSDGDTVMLCTLRDDTVYPVSALSTSGPWLVDSASTIRNDTATSALPDGLQDYSVALQRHRDNCAYIGPSQGTVHELQANIRDTVRYWYTSNAVLDDASTLFPYQFQVVESLTSTSLAANLSVTYFLVALTLAKTIYLVV
jgi:endonuclease I